VLLDQRWHLVIESSGIALHFLFHCVRGHVVSEHVGDKPIII